MSELLRLAFPESGCSDALKHGIIILDSPMYGLAKPQSLSRRRPV